MSTDAQLNLALEQIRIGHLAGAVESLRGLLGWNPNHPEGHALLALVLSDLRRLHAAEIEAKIALELAPELPLALHAATVVALNGRRFGQAGELIGHWMAVAPEDPHACLAKARLCEHEGKRDEVLPWLERARGLDPDNEDIATRLGEYFLERGDLFRAESLAREALQTSPGDVDALVLMGNVLLRRGFLEEARDHALWALGADANDRGALTLLTALQARKSLLLGWWWRYNNWMEGLGETRSILVLLGAFVLYRFAAIFAGQNQQPGLAQLINFLWLGIVVYTWVGPMWFRRALDKELAGVKLRRDF